ncbi:MAG: acetyl-CoA carboxylase biotin carboxylase subunit [Candidatus Micropelagos thuwalensis]|nr:acetyl-CoA carboxylase biotin carboxylase subunit [Candidatus Micropelagos thuwalensis]
MSSIRKILIANRGEIAVRVIQTARRLGISTVAVYSDADVEAPHVALADEAILIGPGPVGESYLVIDNILEAARQTNADAIHPGYGFLSENADFADAVQKAGLIFIGPDAEAISLMGNKAAAKRRMIEAGVPCVPGYEDADQSDERLIQAAKEIKFPIMVKAAAGGGGRGMRLVQDMDEFKSALVTARSEAANAFGSDELILEKAIIYPRHVEIQVFADRYGHVVHLGERDCSVQRRHQKVIEESPCPVMTPELRADMGAAAVEAARNINYVGAGTVEFLLDQSGAYYFLEMNTRLQVEHPVTEMVTGLDLVELQIKVAQGDTLDLQQEDVSLDGHAIEVRLYAEDPNNDFMPATGKIAAWRPAVMENVRFDDGVVEGQNISPFYDPMVAKVIAYGDDRETARKRLVEALRQTALLGPATNRDFLVTCLEKETFIKGEATTAFIGEIFGETGYTAEPLSSEMVALQGVLHFIHDREQALSRAISVPDALKNFSTSGSLQTPYSLLIGDEVFDLTVSSAKVGSYHVDIAVEEGADKVLIETHDVEQVSPDVSISFNVNNQIIKSLAVIDSNVLYHALQSADTAIFLSSINQLVVTDDGADGSAGGLVTAPLHGRVIDVFVKVGDKVAEGQKLAIIEAMKMQHEIFSEVEGIVVDVRIVSDQQVSVNDLMIEIVEENVGDEENA